MWKSADEVSSDLMLDYYQKSQGTFQFEQLWKEIILTVDSLMATVDGQPHTLDAPPFISAEAGRTLVPIRFISETIGAVVEAVMYMPLPSGMRRIALIRCRRISSRSLRIFALTKNACSMERQAAEG